MATARRIARMGPDGRGWRIGEQYVQLPVDEKMLRKDPTGACKWQAVRDAAALVAGGQGIRLLCHCRWTRAVATGCRRCHCEPTAEHAEQEAERMLAADEARHEEARLEAARRPPDKDAAPRGAPPAEPPQRLQEDAAAEEAEAADELHATLGEAVAKVRERLI